MTIGWKSFDASSRDYFSSEQSTTLRSGRISATRPVHPRGKLISRVRCLSHRAAGRAIRVGHSRGDGSSCLCISRPAACTVNSGGGPFHWEAQNDTRSIPRCVVLNRRGIGFSRGFSRRHSVRTFLSKRERLPALDKPLGRGPAGIQRAGR